MHWLHTYAMRRGACQAVSVGEGDKRWFVCLEARSGAGAQGILASGSQAACAREGAGERRRGGHAQVHNR
jgi:hypothetical protein